MIASSQSWPVCGSYLDSLLNVISDLNLDHIFAHADEDILSKLYQIKWNDPEKYMNIELLPGGFHFVRIFYAFLYKRFSVFDLNFLQIW